MAKDGPGGEKTEAATPQRVKKAKKDGELGKTPEFGTWLGIGVASVMVPYTVEKGVEKARTLFTQVNHFVADPDEGKLGAVSFDALFAVVLIVLPLALCMLLTGVIASAMQGGIHWVSKTIKPNPKKLNPINGLKRMFGPQALWELTKALIKTGVLGIVLWNTTGDVQAMVAQSGALPLSSVIGVVADTAITMLQVAAAAGILIAICDFIIVKRRSLKQIKMSKYEVKQEYKQQEGDPIFKARRRAMGRQMSTGSIKKAVEEAAVVLVNPTHYAVVIRFDPEAEGIPIVTAKGANAKAAKIREFATDMRVPLVSDIPLTRALHSSCDVGQPIPRELFDAVGRVILFIQNLKARGIAAGLHSPGFPAPNTEGLPKAGRRRPQ